MNTLTLYQVDAFSTPPFTGNPAAVCLLDKTRPDEWDETKKSVPRGYPILIP